MTEDECTHVWITNSGRGGGPEFKLNSQMSTEPLVYALCGICGARTWLTEAQWKVFATGKEAISTGEQYEPSTDRL